MLIAFTVGTNKVHVKVDGSEKEKVIAEDCPNSDYTYFLQHLLTCCSNWNSVALDTKGLELRGRQ